MSNKKLTTKLKVDYENIHLLKGRFNPKEWKFITLAMKEYDCTADKSTCKELIKRCDTPVAWTFGVDRSKILQKLCGIEEDKLTSALYTRVYSYWHPDISLVPAKPGSKQCYIANNLSPTHHGHCKLALKKFINF